ncbi:MAG: phosphoglycerate kinase [candidate division Zixibacteria bacterium HGW-Zixibacteria-1]|nr:MAG: phosphoglycerate kinase [candidate division Zixibacteria bacterium HGW-Zixibacteria-1]
MNKLTVSNINFKGKRVLIRVDFNVPLDSQQHITDDRRIVASLPTINRIINDGGRLILCSHLGRPKGKVVPEMSLKPAAARLSELLGKEVMFAPDCVGDMVASMADALGEGDVMLLENLRFHPEETDNDPGFSGQLAKLADVYVNDAFGSAHRAHASTEGVTKYFDTCAAGLLMEKELEYLGNALFAPRRPFVAILGGAKISGKIDVIENLMTKVDSIIIGGGMVFTFLKAMGKEIGDSLLEADKLGLAGEILKKAVAKKVRLIFPTDFAVAADVNDSRVTVVSADKIPAGMKGLDIGPDSIKQFSVELKNAKTVVWNGPMGVFEVEKFAAGTYGIARILADITAKGAVTVVGGGDSASAVSKCGLDDKLTHISTGGGASLEFLEGKILPGVAALTDAK